MRLDALISIGLLATAGTLGADTLGFVQQKFGDLHFEQHKWSRTTQLPCYVYTAEADGAGVDVLRIGTGNFVPFRAKKGSTVTVCGSVAAFDEGFQTGLPVEGRADPKQTRY